ncbi:MAG TPA: TadE/TadG family type IV pilus assembly protein [Pyrinomonadaceae bacterium]|nr:TadE/TadG family type IV pilus assembly protein [Pyrinomonadaceae bacterium]
MTRHPEKERPSERGTTLLEFALAATVFLTVMFGVVEFGRCLWTHNALSDAARRGARYAVNHPEADEEDVKKVAVYGDPKGGTTPLVNNLTVDNVKVKYTSFKLGEGRVSVRITDYQFQFVVPLVGKTLTMPDYMTTLTGENIGYVPKPLP